MRGTPGEKDAGMCSPRTGSNATITLKRTARMLAATALSGLAALIGVAAAAATPAAAAEEPEWRVSTITNPTNIVPDAPRNEIQEVKVDATGGTFQLIWEIEWGTYKTEEATAALPYDATATEVAEALEALTGLQEGVTVTGAGTGATSPYEVTFDGTTEEFSYSEFAGGQPHPLLRIDTKSLTGGTASVSEVQRGEYAPELRVEATNVGGAAASGSPITVKVTLPSGLKATSVTGADAYETPLRESTRGSLSCTAIASGSPVEAVSCTQSKEVVPGDSILMSVTLAAGENLPSTVDVETSVSGSNAPAVSERQALTVGSHAPVAFGTVPGSVFAAISSHQAGGHPNVTTGFSVTTKAPGVLTDYPGTVRFDLPPGLVGQAAGMPRCTMGGVTGKNFGVSECPSDTMVGTATVSVFLPFDNTARPHQPPVTLTVPVYNIQPAPGEPVAFGFKVLLLPVRIDTSVLSDGDYGVRVSTDALTQGAETLTAVTTIWGVPGQHSGPGKEKTLQTIFARETFGGPQPAGPPVPLLTNPQQCGSPLSARLEADAWHDQGHFGTSEPIPMGTLTGCEQLRLEPTFSMVPDTLEAGAPAGYHFKLHVPQVNEVGIPATPTANALKLTLPAGTVVNPAAAWGLKACSEEEFYGPNHPSQQPAPLAKCPRESQVGKVRVKTPALEEALEGRVYLAEPECKGPCTPEDAKDGKMVRLFVQFVSEGEGGIVVKLEGHGDINQQTGQITTVFENTPQLPFSEFQLELNGGPRAVLANPRSCGPVSSSLNVASWDEALPASALSYGFEVKEDCFGPQFKPYFSAGVPNVQAGEHGEFTLAFGRTDKDQFLKQITLKMPPGLLGTLKGIPLCAEAQANAGTCGAGSLIGEAQVLTGPGADPFLVGGGKVYLTKGYGGSEFGLSIVVPAVAGPYTLAGTTGRGTVVVRSQLFIDPHTAQITAVSGPVPSALDGIPLQLRAVDVKLNRPGFMFNPTSCEKMAVTGSIASWEGLTAKVSSPFQMANCAGRPFKPKLTALTRARHTRKDGAYLHVVMESGRGQANIRQVRVALPREMPSVMRTLKHACTEAQFDKDPAGCPKESRVGHATVYTPVLPVPLRGPAYFVSYGNAQYPELVMVLKGYGVTIVLSGETRLHSGNRITSTFKSVPDVPFSRFDLVLPTRSYPALAGTTNFCRHKMVMPTRIVAQSGKVVEQNTKVQVSGCKAEVWVVKHDTHGANATIMVHVPSKGKLVANGKGIQPATKRVKKKGGPAGITVHLTRRLRRKLRRHHGHVEEKVRLAFHSKHKTLHASVKVRLS